MKKSIKGFVYYPYILLFSVIGCLAIPVLTLAAKKAGNTKAELIAPHTIPMYIWLAVYSVLFLLTAFWFVKKKVKISEETCVLILFMVLAASFIIKIAISLHSKGFANDVACFKGWSASAAKDLFGFYDNQGFADYPPFYVYFLAIAGTIAKTGIPDLIAFRLPPLIAEIVLSFLIYRMGSKYYTRAAGLFIALAFALNPMVILDTAVWGQMDTFLVLFVVLSLYSLMNNKPVTASIILACAILIKPQGVFFLPLLIAGIIKTKSLKSFLLSGIAGLSTIVLIILPFSKNKFIPAESESVKTLTGLLGSFAHNIAELPVIKDILWLSDLLTGTASTYDYAAFNSANFYAMLGFNTSVKDSHIYNGLPFSTWGLIGIAIIVIIGVFFILFSRKRSVLWLTAAFFNAGIFMFATRMHERYMFTVFALLLISWFFTADFITPLLAICFTITNYLNIDDCLTRMIVTDYPHIPPDSTRMINTSAANMILFILLFFSIIYYMFFKRKQRNGNKLKENIY